MTSIMSHSMATPYLRFMKLHVNPRVLHLLVAFSPLTCYLEWGGNNSDYLLSMEVQLLRDAVDHATAITHPVVLLPLLGQMIVLLALISPDRLRMLAITGQLMLSLLIGLIFLSGLLQWKLLILLSTVPFLISSMLFYSAYRKKEWKGEFIHQ